MECCGIRSLNCSPEKRQEPFSCDTTHISQREWAGKVSYHVHIRQSAAPRNHPTQQVNERSTRRHRPSAVGDSLEDRCDYRTTYGASGFEDSRTLRMSISKSWSESIPSCRSWLLDGRSCKIVPEVMRESVIACWSFNTNIKNHRSGSENQVDQGING